MVGAWHGGKTGGAEAAVEGGQHICRRDMSPTVIITQGIVLRRACPTSHEDLSTLDQNQNQTCSNPPWPSLPGEYAFACLPCHPAKECPTKRPPHVCFNKFGRIPNSHPHQEGVFWHMGIAEDGGLGI